MVTKKEYTVYSIGPLSKRRCEGRRDAKQDAKEYFQRLCESFPKEKFSVVCKTTLEETICESEDYRQSLFPF